MEGKAAPGEVAASEVAAAEVVAAAEAATEAMALEAATADVMTIEVNTNSLHVFATATGLIFGVDRRLLHSLVFLKPLALRRPEMGVKVSY